MPRLSRRTWTALLGLAGLAVLLVGLGLLSPGGSPDGSSGSSSGSGTGGGAASSGPSAAPSTVRSSAASTRSSAQSSTRSTGSSSRPVGVPAGVPAKVLAVLRVVDDTGQPPQGFVGGRQFMNDGRGGTTGLPRRAVDGSPVEYQEYDVNPRRSGVNRGPQRLVVGDDGSAYYTSDHYVTWVRIR
jgi:ribonuclease T1